MEEISNFSPNVHFQKDSNMFSIIIFTLVLLGYTNACLEGKCRCHEELRVIDCTSVGLRSMPHATSTLDNYTSILLRDNYLKHLNFTSVFKVLPQVVLLDLRDNNPLLCQDITRFQPSKLIHIISDCKFSSAKIPTHSTSAEIQTHSTSAEIPTTHNTKTTTYHPLSPNSKPSISRNFTSHLTTQISRVKTSNQVLWYIYSLIVTLIIIPTTVILFRLIIRCWKSRLSQRPPSAMLHLLPLKFEGDEEDNQSEEDVIFIRTTEL